MVANGVSRLPDVASAVSWWRSFTGWPRLARWTTYVAVLLVLVLVVGSLGAVWLVRRPLPQVSGTLTLPGLSAPVQVVRDSHGIPQIYADTSADLFRAEGYVQAQDRFYEMDVRRHITAGTLSELFGSTTLDVDKVVRTMGWRRVAARELALVSPATRAALQEYADGVNAYLQVNTPSQISVEYTLLRATGFDYVPAPWTPLDSLSWLKAMAWDLRGNMDDEIDRVLIGVDHTPAQLAQLYPAYPYGSHAPIVGSGEVVGGRFEQDAKSTSATEAAARRPAWTPGEVAALRTAQTVLHGVPTTLAGPGQSGSTSRDGLGSNSWVVSGAHTTTGEPLLANDPHLGVSLPGIWYQIGLHCRTVGPACPYDVTGFSFSGLPGVVIGHNAHIAWGLTNLSPDVSDLFLEKIRGDRWRYAGRWRPLVTRPETIHVRGAADVHLTVRSTRHGPILSDVDQELASVGANARAPGGQRPATAYAVSLEWTALTPSDTMDAVLEIDRATDWSEFRTAARDFAVPAQNLVYADTAGHIGYQAPGQVPIRRSGNDGLVPSAGWLRRDDWTGRYVPFDALPSELDPAQGFIATANQAVVGPGYPYYLTDDWDYGYRSQRIRDRLEQLTADGGKVSVADLSFLQLDDDSAMAHVLVPYLLDVSLPKGFDSTGQRLLRGWDFRMDADSAAAAYFAVVWRQLLGLTFHDELRRSLWPDGDSRWFAVMTGLLRDPTSSWWDDRGTDGVVETRDDILRQALLAARVEITKRESLDPADWTWGRLHRLDLRNATLGESGVAPVERLLDRGGWGVSGSSSVVDASAWDAGSGYDVVSAPSMRMVVDLSDLDASRWINLTGASGHPMSGHYTDQTELYVRGQTLAWPFSRSAVSAEQDSDTLTLEPGD